MSRLAHPDRPHHVPQYPGPLPRKPPEPPKFLLTTEESGDGNKKQQLVKVTRGAPSRPKGVSDEPVMAKLATTTTSRDFVSPPNHFPKRIPYQIPSEGKQPRRKAKDSSRDVKPVHRSSIVVEESNQPYGTPFSTSAVPKLPAIPRPFVPKPRADYAHLPNMHQRNAGGQIFGGATRRYVPAEHVPYQEPAGGGEHSQYDQTVQQYDQTGQQYDQIEQQYDQGDQQYQVCLYEEDTPVGPDNPMKQLSDAWSACWDGEAGAVYYYNHSSGEATWIMPDDLGT